jgi:hypothetical protein
MLTDLRLQKYLQGMLSEEEAKEVEAMLAKSPEMAARLEELKAQSDIVGRPMWRRVLLDRKTRHHGSRTRATILLPLLLVIAVVLTLGGHWFSRPGENSTFTLSGGNGTALEVLYNSAKGWRFLDAGFRSGDSLTFAVRDDGAYHVAIYSVFGRGSGAEVLPRLTDAPGQRFDRRSPKPAFLAGDSAHPGKPAQIIVFYDDTPLPELPAHRVLDILESKGNERGGLDFQYQVFSSGP